MILHLFFWGPPQESISASLHGAKVTERPRWRLEEANNPRPTESFELITDRGLLVIDVGTHIQTNDTWDGVDEPTINLECMGVYSTRTIEPNF